MTVTGSITLHFILSSLYYRVTVEIWSYLYLVSHDYRNLFVFLFACTCNFHNIYDLEVFMYKLNNHSNYSINCSYSTFTWAYRYIIKGWLMFNVETPDSKWVNSILNIIGVNSLRLEGVQIYLNWSNFLPGYVFYLYKISFWVKQCVNLLPVTDLHKLHSPVEK